MSSFAKRGATIAVALCVLFPSLWGGARIHWPLTECNFGVIEESAGQATATFLYVNTGDEPLVITSARANCGCTTPRYSTSALAPGDTAALVVSYDPAGRPGRFAKKVYVDTNTEPSRSTLTVTGVVIGTPETLAGRYPVQVGPLRLVHPGVLLGKMTRGHVKSVFESACNASADTLCPVVTDVPKWLEVNTVPPVVPPGEITSFNFYVRSDKIPGWDVVTDTVTVRPFADSTESYRMPVTVTVTEDFSRLTDADRAKAPVVNVSARRLDPVEMDVASADVRTVTLKVRNDGRTPMRLRRLYATPTDLPVSLTTDLRPDETLKPGKSRTIKITLTPITSHEGGGNATKGKTGAYRGAGQIILHLITNDPASPKTTITLPVSVMGEQVNAYE